jgi:hypothetical protein
MQRAMMSSEPILLEGPIDFLIFSSRVVYLQDNHNGEQLTGSIVDRADGCITIQLSEPCSSLSTKINDYQVGASYKSQQLTFDVVVQQRDHNNQLIVAKHPTHGTLATKRYAFRRPFSDKANLQAELTIQSTLHELAFTTTALVDFTLSSLSLAVDRAQGLALPGDRVESIRIYLDGQCVFNGNGTVTRIDTDYDKDNADCYLVVIEVIHVKNNTVVEFNKNKRRSDRTILIDTQSAFLQFSHPFLHNSTITCPIADLSNSGMSIILEDSPPIPKGLLVHSASLQLPYKSRLEVSFKTTSIQRIVNDEKEVDRVGLQLIDIKPATLKEITNFVQKENSDYLVDANAEDYDRLWEFHFESGFIYGSKRRQIQNYARETFHTYRQLLQSDTSLIKKILYKVDGAIKGDITAIKIFDNTFIIQHLNALKASGASAAQQVIRGMTTFFLDSFANKNADNRYVCAYFRPQNLYPSLVFGETANLIKNSKNCWTKTYDFCLPDGSDLASSSLPWREANEDDLKQLENLLIARQQHQMMRVEGLTREGFLTLQVSEEYEKIGLYRKRRIFVAWNPDNGAVGYAICNYASPGINFSELTNSVKFIYNKDDNINDNQLLADVLGKCVLESYQQTLMPKCVLLLHSQPIPKGFVHEKSYVEWVLDLDHVADFRAATEEIFGNLRHFIRMKKATLNNVSTG